MTEEALAEARREVRHRAVRGPRLTDTHVFMVIATTVGKDFRHRRYWAVKWVRDPWEHLPTVQGFHDRFVAGDPDVDEWEVWS